MSDVNRREFLIGSLACGACALCPHVVRAAPSTPIDIGTVADFSKDGITDKWAEVHDFFVIRRRGRLYAVSATCTHKAFDLVAQDNAIKCPKHGSLFSLEGKVEKAPARKTLPRYGISINSEGRIMVDSSRRFLEKNWSDPGAFLQL
jgi:nitrite reductase/ring-hydroxylating ferredoxin subunit